MKKKLVVLSGAGISAESGLKTFRDSDGLWEGYRVEEVATPQAFAHNPAMVLGFYNFRRAQVLAAKPNQAHIAMAQLQAHYEVQIVTQNIDDLHERAGSKNVLHLHGEILKMRSVKNAHKTYPITTDIKLGDIAPDGGQLRPHIVWFGEAVPMLESAIPYMQQADLFLVVGTSLVVYPAAGLIDFVPAHVPKYVVDRKLPPMSRYQNVIPIEKPATEGMQDILSLLLRAGE